MSSTDCRGFSVIIVALWILLLIIQASGKAIDLEDEEDDDITFNKLPKRKSARMAFLEESDDPMFKFLRKLLNTAQMRTKNRLARAQNGMKKAQELKIEVSKRLMNNHLPLEHD